MAVWRYRWRVLLLAVAVAVLAAVVGSRVVGHLSSAGYFDRHAESSVVAEELNARFHTGVTGVVVMADSTAPVTDPRTDSAGMRLTRDLARVPGVVSVRSWWNSADRQLVADGGRSTLIEVALTSDERAMRHAVRDIESGFTGEHAMFTLSVTGDAVIAQYIEDRTGHDLGVAEVYSLPLVALVLLWTFGSLAAAALPLVSGMLAIVGTAAVIDVLTRWTEVSSFAMNLTTALGFGLSVDYSLILVSRFREELAERRSVAESLRRMYATAARTVLFSALAVTIGFATLLLFPMPLFRSLGLASVAVVLWAGAAALLVTPALLAVVGPGIERGGLPGRLGGSDPIASRAMWSALAERVLRRPVLVLISGSAVLVVLGLPFTGARFGFIDQRWIPPGAPSSVVAGQVAGRFPLATGAAPVVLLTEADPRSPAVSTYLTAVSSRPEVIGVTGPQGTYVHGRLAGHRPDTPGAPEGRGTWFTVSTALDPSGDQAQALVRRLRAGPAPGPVLVGGTTAALIDFTAGVRHQLSISVPLAVAGLFAVILLLLRSVLIPLKAVVMNVLSMTASFGALVFVFQDGHLLSLVGARPTGRLDPMLPTIMVCIVFAVSMDYELIMVHRIREAYLATGDNRAAVVTGLSRTGRLVTSASLVVIVTVGALASSPLTAPKVMGVGLALAVAVDATIVRCLLVPAFMGIAGRWNWWLPGRPGSRGAIPAQVPAPTPTSTI